MRRAEFVAGFTVSLMALESAFAPGVEEPSSPPAREHLASASTTPPQQAGRLALNQTNVSIDSTSSTSLYRETTTSSTTSTTVAASSQKVSEPYLVKITAPTSQQLEANHQIIEDILRPMLRSMNIATPDPITDGEKELVTDDSFIIRQDGCDGLVEISDERLFVTKGLEEVDTGTPATKRLDIFLVAQQGQLRSDYGIVQPGQEPTVKTTIIHYDPGGDTINTEFQPDNPESTRKTLEKTQRMIVTACATGIIYDPLDPNPTASTTVPPTTTP